jgi:hypothetical protein
MPGRSNAAGPINHSLQLRNSMKFLQTLSLLLYTLAISCAPTRELSLATAPTTAVYLASTEDVVNSLRSFVTSEEFKLIRFLPESGQIQAGKRLEEKNLIMKVVVTSVGPSTSRVEARFLIRDYENNMSPSEERLVAEYQYRLFDFLSDRFAAATPSAP